MLLFPGFVVSVLVGLAMLPVVSLVQYRRLQNLKGLFVVILLSSLLLSLGPLLVLLGVNTGIPLPYQIFYYVVPGFQAMRVPARFAYGCTGCERVAGLGFLKACQHLRGRSACGTGIGFLWKAFWLSSGCACLSLNWASNRYLS